MTATCRKRSGGWLEGGLALALGVLAGVARAEVAAAATAAAPDCAPWPGEPAPLPTTATADRLGARWAHDRAAALGELADQLASEDPAAAGRLHAHALCLDPQRASAQRPQPEHRSLPAPALRAIPEQELGAVDAGLAELERAVAAARFRNALSAAPRLRAMLEALETAPAVQARQAALEVAVATAYTALGRSSDAARSLGRALAAEPGLELSPESPPKLQRALARARAPRGPQP